MSSTSPAYGPLVRLGSKMTCPDRGSKLKDIKALNDYANAVSYYPGWTFFAEYTGKLVCQYHTDDPHDQRTQIRVSRERDVTLPATRTVIDHLILDLIQEVEDHERLEWLHRNTATGPRHLFPPHPKGSGPKGVVGTFSFPGETFDFGKQVYRDHVAWMGEHGYERLGGAA